MTDVGSVRYEVTLDDSKVAQQAEKTEKTIVSTLGGVVGKVGAASAAAVGLTVGGIAMAGNKIAGLADDVSKAGDEIDKMSQKIGISAEAYQEWDYVFERSGADVKNLQVSMKTLSGVITDAANGSKSAAEKLAALGLSIEDVNNLSQEEQLALVIERLQGMEQGAERTAAASDLLGRAATDMAAVLNMTAEDTQALIDEAHEYGMVMSDEAVAASASYQDSLTKLNHTVGGLKNQLVANLLPGLTQVVNGFADVVNGTKSLDEAIDQGITEVVSSLDESLPQMIERGTEIITSVADGITNNLPTILDAAGHIIAALIQGIIKVLPTLLEAALNIVMTLAAYIIQHIPDLAAAALDLVVGIVKFIIENAPKMIESAIELIGKLAAGLIQSIPKVNDAIGDIIGAIFNKFGEIDWGSVGKNIIDGIKNGIVNAAGALGDAIKDVGSNLLGGAKRFFGIESPSKVFRDQVGQPIAAGVAVGIEDGSDLVTGSMDRMIRDFTADVSYRVPRLSDYAADLGASITASAATEITVPLIVDGREMARATAWYTNEQLAWEAR